MKEYLLVALLLIFSLSTVSYVDVAYADTVQVQTHSDFETQIASGTESEITSTYAHQTTTSTGSAEFSTIEISTASHYTTQTGETLEIDMVHQESQHIFTDVNTLTTDTFEIYQNQYPTSVNTLTTMEGISNETNQNQPFTNANTLTEIDTSIETNQNQYSGVNVLTIITSVNALTDASAHESSETACPEKR